MWNEAENYSIYTMEKLNGNPPLVSTDTNFGIVINLNCSWILKLQQCHWHLTMKLVLTSLQPIPHCIARVSETDILDPCFVMTTRKKLRWLDVDFFLPNSGKALWDTNKLSWPFVCARMFGNQDHRHHVMLVRRLVRCMWITDATKNSYFLNKNVYFLVLCLVTYPQILHECIAIAKIRLHVKNILRKKTIFCFVFERNNWHYSSFFSFLFFRLKLICNFTQLV